MGFPRGLCKQYIEVFDPINQSGYSRTETEGLNLNLLNSFWLQCHPEMCHIGKDEVAIKEKKYHSIMAKIREEFQVF